MTAPKGTTADLAEQEQYVAAMKAKAFNYGIAVADAFVRGIRDIGYRHTGTALDEQIDNAIQAGAQNVHVAFGFTGTSDKKPTAMAVIDDAHGMIPEMIRLATIWGGTHRENNREGWGRYGYGLPSSCVSQGKRFTVYSRVDDGAFHAVTIDLDDLGSGKYLDQKRGEVVVPQPEKAKLPAWVVEYVKNVKNGFSGGIDKVRTVVLTEKLDRVTWSTATALERNLLEHFGITYRNFFGQVNLAVAGKTVEAVDPLFTTPTARFYDLDEDRAEALDSLTIDVKDQETRKVLGTVKVRFSYLPPTFQREDKQKERGRMNARFAIMKDHNGIIFMRNGRQIDVVTKCPWTTFMTYDRNWKVEVDFPPTLDEEFSITTSKQQVVVSARIWDLLEEAGVLRAITELRRRFKEESGIVRANLEENEDAKRASEIAMEEAMTYVPKVPLDVDREKKAQEVLDLEARRRAKEGKVPLEDAVRVLETEVKQRPYKVEQRSLRGAPFFSVEQRGGQKVLVLNTAHRFYPDVYAGPESTPRLRAALEVVLFTIGDCELDAVEERQLWYGMERAEWSKRLEVTLALLDKIDASMIEVPDEDLEPSESVQS